MSNELIVRSMDDVKTAASAMAKSRYFTDAVDVAQAAVKIMAGHEMGFGAFTSMIGIHIINGKPGLGSNLIAAAIKRHPNYNYHVNIMDDKVCEIEFFEMWDGKWASAGISRFTIEDAKKAGTKNLDKFPRNMLFARAMSNGGKWFCPDIIGGGPVYTPEELGAVEDEDGYIIEIDPKPVTVRTEPEIIEALGFDAKPEPREEAEAEADTTDDERTAKVERLVAQLRAFDKPAQCSDNQRMLLRHVIDDVVFQDGNAHHMLFKMLYNEPSVKSISGGAVDGLLNWLNPVKGSDGEYTTDKVKALHALKWYAEVKDGQLALFAAQPA